MSMHSAKQRRPRLTDGVRTGLVGATAIWLWLLAVDVIAGEPLHTSGVLGRDLVGIFLPSLHTSLAGGVVAFTLAHYALWMLLGTLIVRAIAADVRSPGILIMAVFIFTLLQLAFVGITEIFNETQLRRHAWPALFGGNVIGLLVAGAYLARRHPALRAQLRRDGHG
jgi:hypothetical protein